MIETMIKYHDGIRLQIRVDIDDVTGQHTVLTLLVEGVDLTQSELIRWDFIDRLIRSSGT